MSMWHLVSKLEEIDIDGDSINIHVGTDYNGAIYLEIPISLMRQALENNNNKKGAGNVL